MENTVYVIAPGPPRTLQTLTNRGSLRTATRRKGKRSTMTSDANYRGERKYLEPGRKPNSLGRPVQ